jgi:UDP-N-acetylmuramoyl-tripeptide--D-alanyl-D-alanine ligase
MDARTSARVLTFGTHGQVSWRGLELDDLGRPSFELGHAGEWQPVHLAQPGAHQVANAAAAAAMAVAVGLPLPEVARALTASRAASPMRMDLRERADGLIVVNDAYNANPASMTAAVEALVAIGTRRRRRTVAVLGVMLELGEGSAEAHREVGRLAAAAGVDVLVAVGEPARGLADGFSSVRPDADDHGVVIVTAGRDEALTWVRENVAAEDVVLVKASRGAALELVADGLLEEGEVPTR